MDESKKKPTTAPVKTIRHGAIAASIWKRQATSGFEYFDFTVSRSWKTSATGKEGYSSSFFWTLPIALRGSASMYRISLGRL